MYSAAAMSDAVIHSSSTQVGEIYLCSDNYNTPGSSALNVSMPRKAFDHYSKLVLHRIQTENLNYNPTTTTTPPVLCITFTGLGNFKMCAMVNNVNNNDNTLYVPVPALQISSQYQTFEFDNPLVLNQPDIFDKVGQQKDAPRNITLQLSAPNDTKAVVATRIHLWLRSFKHADQ